MSYLSPPKPPWKEGYFKNHNEADSGPPGLNQWQLTLLKMEIIGECKNRIQALEKEVEVLKTSRNMMWIVIVSLAIIMLIIQ